MRQYVRHPSDIPIEVIPEGLSEIDQNYLNNVSKGGLSFITDTSFDMGRILKIRISFVKPEFEAKGRVIWCNNEGNKFEIGVEFLEQKDEFRVRMIEQVCHIEHYKKEIREKEGRVLSATEAAMEWIGKFANNFHTEMTKK